MTHPTPAGPAARRVLEYPPRQPIVDPRADGLGQEAQAALRQFSEDRLIGYGVDRSDAIEVRERVLNGAEWAHACSAVAERCRLGARTHTGAAHTATRIAYLRRASALMRMSQVMHLIDIPQRREVYARAGEYYGLAANLSGDRHRVVLDSPDGPMVGWRVRTRTAAVGAAVVIGGVEGYAMDFDSLGEALAARGIECLLLDAPGQGETRFTLEHYLTTGWRTAFTSAIDYLEALSPGRPIGLIGNSMGGSLMVSVASTDPRIRACVNNGGIPTPGDVPASIGTFFTKMMAFCGTGDADAATRTWSTVTPLTPGVNSTYALLTVHGGADALVSQAMAEGMFRYAPTSESQMVTFSDGDHCIYNHKADRDILIADWMREHLGRPGQAIENTALEEEARS